MGVVVEEGEAVAVAGELVVAQHGVAQAAGLTDDRYGAVTQGDQLAQTAGLKLAGHEEHVAAGVDLMGQGMVHRKARGHLALVFTFCPGEQVHIAAFAHAQDHQLHVLLEQIADDVVHQVQALLIAQTAHHADDRHVGVHVQAQLLLQVGLADGLALQIVSGVGRGNALVDGGVVVHHVDAVEHAKDLMLAGTEQAVQTLAVVSGLDFLRVGGADGGDQVGVHQRRLHEVGAAIALQLVIRPQRGIGQPQDFLDLVDAEHALILQVVDGVHGLDAREEGQMGVLNLQQRRHHAALPVMGVDHVGLEVQQGQAVQGRAAEEAEALVLVAAHAVNVGTTKVELVVHEVPLHAVLLDHLDAAVLTAPAKLHLKVAHVGHLAGPLLGNGRIQGHNDANVMAFLGQHGSQRTNHVRQTAGLDKGDAFAGRKQDLHNWFNLQVEVKISDLEHVKRPRQ